MQHMILENESNEAYDKINQELRRGILVIAVLSQLDQEMHGYALLSILNEKGLSIDQGTLYPLLRRLESQGLLQSDWNTEGSRPRRYYQMSEQGKQVLQALKSDWYTVAEVINGLLSK
jgi:PadR family transcriptional regulator PadR